MARLSDLRDRMLSMFLTEKAGNHLRLDRFRKRKIRAIIYRVQRLYGCNRQENDLVVPWEKWLKLGRYHPGRSAS